MAGRMWTRAWHACRVRLCAWGVLARHEPRPGPGRLLLDRSRRQRAGPVLVALALLLGLCGGVGHHPQRLPRRALPVPSVRLPSRACTVYLSTLLGAGMGSSCVQTPPSITDPEKHLSLRGRCMEETQRSAMCCHAGTCCTRCGRARSFTPWSCIGSGRARCALLIAALVSRKALPAGCSARSGTHVSPHHAAVPRACPLRLLDDCMQGWLSPFRVDCATGQPEVLLSRSMGVVDFAGSGNVHMTGTPPCMQSHART